MTKTFSIREYDRLQLEPMYTSVTVQRAEGMSLRSVEGHAYDVSEAGIRIELDDVLTVGEPVSMSLRLGAEIIFVSGRVVWVNDEIDDPGARRAAIQFTSFSSAGDRDRLVRHLGPGHRRRSA